MENIQLTALIPHDMEPAQKQLIGWCENKIASLKADVKEMEDAMYQASTMRWALQPLKNQFKKLSKRVLFFEKMKMALDNGYTIVPNFPVQIFAIRTTRENPLSKTNNSRWDNKVQDAMELPVGKGEYQNPFPIVEVESYKSGDRTDYISNATDWAEMEFPLTMAKPEIIEATNRAMLLECFDQFGIMPATRNDDPIIIGQLVNGKKTLSFMIAWHFDTKVL
jgi:hypothetical protein